MHDIRLIRLNPEEFDKKMGLRKLSGVSTKILELDKARRIRIKAAEEALAERNSASKKIGKAKADNDEAEFAKLKILVSKKKNEILRLEDEAKKEDKILNDFLMRLPNLPLDDVPIGENEDDNLEIKRWGEIPSFDFSPKEHFELAATVKDMDFEIARNLSGSRFVVLRGPIARIHRALTQFMIDIHTEKHGLIEMNTPVLVRDQAKQ